MKHTIFTLLFAITCLASKGSDTTSFANNTSLEISKPLHISNVTTERRNRNHFQKGVHILGLGYGVPNFSGAPFKDLVDKYDTAASVSGIGPAFIKYEYAATDRIGIGAVIRYSSSKVEYPIESTEYDVNGNRTTADSTYTYAQSRMSIAAMARINYHFSTSRRFDPYAGLGIGYGYNNIKLDNGGDLAGSTATVQAPLALATEFSVGARFFITPKFTIFGELGLSQSVANFGVSFKLK